MFPKPYFVMLWNQKQTRLVPLRDENDELMMFSTVYGAIEAARETGFGAAFGYDIFEAGNGIEGEDGI
jgi:hypothetical protein